MLISVTVCTLNRAASLRRTLESLAAMRVPDAIDWEVVVVNNGSTDDTADVIASFASRLPLRSALEPQRGHSPARNRAVDAANGDYLLWTDDDVIVDPGWLAAYADAFRRWPGAAVFGGPIKARFEPAPPQWVVEGREFIASAFAERDLGAAAQPLSGTPDRVPWGPNYAVRAATQRRYRYRLDLGHAPGRKLYGEEVDVLYRILNSGETGYWVPQARVEHVIGPHRQTTRYVVAYFVGQGETAASLRGPEPGSARLLGVPRWRLRLLAEQWLRFRYHRLASPPAVWARHLAVYARTRGEVLYHRGHKEAVAAQYAPRPSP